MKYFSLATVVALLGVLAVPPWALASPGSLRPAAVEAQKSRYQDAEAVWQRISTRHPESFEAYYNLGIAQANQQKWVAAIDSYSQAIALNPDLIQAYFNLGRAQAKLERYQSAVQSYSRVLVLAPQDRLAEEVRKELNIVAQHSGIDLAILVE